jgi:Mn2+/Fe2+ NRAMP family transporter
MNKTKIKKPKWNLKYKNWFFNRVVNAQWIHKSKTTRRRFRRIYLLFILIMFLAYCVCSALLFTAGLRFYPDGDPSVGNNNTNWYVGVKYGWACYTAITLLIILFIITFVMAIYIPILYKRSKQLYSQSEEFKEHVIKYANADLKKYSKTEIK